MGFSDVLIPLAIGLLLIAVPETFVKRTDPSFEKKRILFRKLGFILIGVAVLYGVIKMFAA